MNFKRLTSFIARFINPGRFLQFACVAAMICVAAAAASAQSSSAPVPAPSAAVASDAKQTLYLFDKAVSKTRRITLGYYPNARRIALAVNDNGHLSGYIADNIETPSGAFEMVLKREFGGSGAPATIVVNLSVTNQKTAQISFADQNTIAFDGDLEVTETNSEMRAGVCDRSNGPCTNVNTDSDWYRCFWCCAAVGCS